MGSSTLLFCLFVVTCKRAEKRQLCYPSKSYRLISTYGMKLPINVGSACVEVEHAANTVLIVKSARLDVACNHKVERGVGWTTRIFHVKVVAANSVSFRSSVFFVKL